MEFKLTEEQLAVRDAARDFAQRECLPGVIERDRDMKFASEQIKMMGELGFMGMMVSPEYGGGGMDSTSYVLAIEEISKIDNSCSVCMSVNNSLVCWGLETYGSEDQKIKYLTKLAMGEWIGAFCLSEPEAGSDATSQRTTAIDMGDHYLLNGTKNWITNGGSSSVHLVIRIGEDGFGFKFAMKVLSGGRIGIAAQALGIAAGAYELAMKYSKEREAFGKPISKHQAIAFKLADMATEIEAARLLVHRAAWVKDNGGKYDTAAAMAKLFASDVAMRHTVEAVQIHGGYGFVKEYHVERLMRDAKITQIYEGTSEIQKLVISRNILKGEIYPALLQVKV